MTTQLRILTMTDYYFPGVNGGGAPRTLSNLVAKLGGEFDFNIVTRDHDLGNDTVYCGIKSDKWNDCGLCKVYYLSKIEQSLRNLRNFIQSCQYDLLYCNSFFSINFTVKPLLLRRFGLIQRTPVIVAPRGELSMAALNIKRNRKRCYLFAGKFLGLYKGAFWQASSEKEASEIATCFGEGARIVIAPDLAPTMQYKKKVSIHKDKGYLKMIFLSRISPIKNLDVALQLLRNVKGNIIFDIYGPIEDKTYWTECQKIIERLPYNITVQYLGVVAGESVIDTMGKYHFFFLPTKSENFGNVIAEAFIAGVPVLISDQTPWRNLEKLGVGWDISLTKLECFIQTVQRCVDMGEQEYQTMVRSVKKMGESCCNDANHVQANRTLFSIAGKNVQM